MLMPAPMVLHDQKGQVAPHFNCLDLKKAVVPLKKPTVSCDTNAGITWHQCQHQCCHMTRKNMLHLTSIILTQGIQWCHWWDHWDHIPLMLMSHDQKDHITPDFDHLDIRSVVVPFRMPLASGDAKLNDVTWWKYHVSSHFNCSDLRNAVVPVMMLLISSLETQMVSHNQ